MTRPASRTAASPVGRATLLVLLVLVACAASGERLPRGAESRADERRLERGEPDAARWLERERLRLEYGHPEPLRSRPRHANPYLERRALKPYTERR